MPLSHFQRPSFCCSFCAAAASSIYVQINIGLHNKLCAGSGCVDGSSSRRWWLKFSPELDGRSVDGRLAQVEGLK